MFMNTTTPTADRLPPDLRAGDLLEVDHIITVGLKNWTTKIAGKVVRVDRVRSGLHFRRNFDDKVFCDSILLQLPDEELSTVTMDEFTTARRIC
jgi:hypothetical protein